MNLPSELEMKAIALQHQGVFLGGPLRKFESVGRNYLEVLLRHGVYPQSKVLDVGCGCLRGGYWLVHFLDSGSYCGIEPNAAMLNAGAAALLGESVLADKRPRFDHNDRLDFSVFRERFDFVIARSIWTHAAPAQIETMLDQFVAWSNPDGVFLTSYRPCPFYRHQYAGTTWVGANDKTREGGTVRYRFSWVRHIAKARGLIATELSREFGQTWVRLERA